MNVNTLHPEHKLNGVIEAALNRAMFDEQWLQDMASDPNIEQNTPDDVFRAIESYITDELALIRGGEGEPMEQGV